MRNIHLVKLLLLALAPALALAADPSSPADKPPKPAERVTQTAMGVTQLSNDQMSWILDAKFGTKTVKAGDEITSWEEKLDDAGIKNIVLSHSAPGDVGLGHKIVKAYLEPHFSVVRNESFPGMLFFAEGCKGARGPIQDMWNYSWDEKNPDKPKEDYKDFPDCVRYAAMEQPVWRAPQQEIDVELARMILARQNDAKEGNPLYTGLVLR